MEKLPIYMGIDGFTKIAGDLVISLVYFKSPLKSDILDWLAEQATRRFILDPILLYQEVSRLQDSWVEVSRVVPCREVNSLTLPVALQKYIELCAYSLCTELEVPVSRIELQLTQVTHPAIYHVPCRRNPQLSANTRLCLALSQLKFLHNLNLYAAVYPQFNWQKNRGVVTRQHVLAILKHGPALGIHRASFLDDLALWIYRQARAGKRDVVPYLKYLSQKRFPWWHLHTTIYSQTDCLSEAQRSDVPRLIAAMQKSHSDDVLLPPPTPRFVEWLKAHPPEEL